MERKRIVIASVVGIIIIVIALILFFIAKSNADKKREEKHNNLIADLCITAVNLSEEYPNTIVLDKETVGSFVYVPFETLSFLTIGTKDSIPRKVENPKESIGDKVVYFSDTSAIKLKVNADKKVVCNGLFDLGNPPVITLKGNSVINIRKGTEFVDPGFEATDKEDGNITNKVLKNNLVDVNKAGEYLLLYYVEDSMGNKNSVTRKVIVK
jgi:hypothetical protein